MARLATGRQAIVVFDHAYHGRTNLTMALTAKNMPYKDRFGPFAPEIYRVPMSYPLRDGGLSGDEAAGARHRCDRDPGGRAQPGRDPHRADPGRRRLHRAGAGFLPALERWARANEVLFIADEIQTGFCRTGDWFACEHEGVVPDLITTAKGIAGGLPLAALTGRRELLDAVHPGGLGGTYGGNPVAAAAALATIEVMRTEQLAQRAVHLNELIVPRLEKLGAETGAIAEVRGRGAMVAVELVRAGTTEPDPALAKAVVAACAREGVIALSCGTFGNVLRLLPPLVIEDALLLEGLDVLGASLIAALA